MSDFFNDTLSIFKLPASEALQSVITRAKDGQSFNSTLNIEEEYKREVSIVEKSQQKVSLKEKDLLMQNLYSIELLNGVEEGSIPPDVTIYLLKSQLIDACLANHNLERLIAANRWRQVVELGNQKILKEQCERQESTISNLDSLVEKSRLIHEKLKRRVDKLENQISLQRAQNNLDTVDHVGMLTENGSIAGSNVDGFGFGGMTLRNHYGGFGMDTMRSSNLREMSSHSLAGAAASHMIIGGHQHIINIKSRFKKPITSKTIGRMF